jgi:hypothetical protein
MKYIILLSFISLLQLAVHSQQQGFEQDRSNSVRVFDNTGRVFTNPANDIEGTPYFFDAWKPGFVTLNNGQKYPRQALRLDVQKHEIHYLAENNVEMMLPAELVRAVTLKDSNSVFVTEYHFQSGFPAIDNQDSHFYYQVLSFGKLTMLRATKKQIKIDKNPLSGEVKKEFQQDENYYFYQPDVITRLKRDKDFVLADMKSHAAEINAYLASHKISFKSIKDIITLVEYYNTLP